MFVRLCWCNGHNSDRGVWSKCALKNAMEQNTMNVSTSTVPPNKNIPVRYICTGDDGFTFHLHKEDLSTIKSNHQKMNF